MLQVEELDGFRFTDPPSWPATCRRTGRPGSGRPGRAGLGPTVYQPTWRSCSRSAGRVARDAPPAAGAEHLGEVLLGAPITSATAPPARSADSVVTDASLIPQGTIRSNQDRSQSQLSAKPCMVTPRDTRMPIAPTLRSGRCRPRRGTQTPLRPSTRSVATPDVGAGPDQRLLDGPHVGDHVDRLGQRDDRVADELAGTVPGDLAAAVHVDHRARPDRRAGRSSGLVRLPAVYTGWCSSSRQVSGISPADPPLVQLPLQIPGTR